MNGEYKKRIVDNILEKKLKGKGAVLIEGIKWCGKTTTGGMHAKSIIYMDDPSQENLMLADINTARLLEGETPHMIDEWQLAPKIWDAVRFEVDHRQKMGQFILTGSSTPAKMDDVHHTGTGRFSWLLMRTMSLYESSDSNGSVSLKDLFDAPEQITGQSDIDIDRLTYLICRGGWPMAVFLDEETSLEQAYDYYDAVVKRDISRVDGISRKETYARKLLHSYARNQGSQISDAGLLSDIKSNEEDAFSIKTLTSYLGALEKIFVIEEMPAWNPNLRSKTAIRTANTRYFSDPSIAAAALGIGPKDLLNDLITLGFLFETLAVRDLRIYTDSLGGNVYHYRDKNDLECDAVIHLRNGKYGLIEIKLGGERLIAEGTKNLKRLAAKIDTTKMNPPSFLAVVTGVGKYAYKNQEGVYIVPIGCLKD